MPDGVKSTSTAPREADSIPWSVETDAQGEGVSLLYHKIAVGLCIPLTKASSKFCELISPVI